jgi:hypothetical protein
MPLASRLAQTLGSTQDFLLAFLRFGCSAIQNPNPASSVNDRAKVLVRAGRSRPVQTRAATGRKDATNHNAHVLRRSGHAEVAVKE